MSSGGEDHPAVLADDVLGRALELRPDHLLAGGLVLGLEGLEILTGPRRTGHQNQHCHQDRPPQRPTSSPKHGSTSINESSASSPRVKNPYSSAMSAHGRTRRATRCPTRQAAGGVRA
ncbi:MAG: hypothetical protein MZV64_25125 [Ignavibacteriales bacterium]|nr:hypothetical protein [Ignavibacteriales bacterium]